MTIYPVAPRKLALLLVVVLAALGSLSAQQKSDCAVKVTLLQVNDVYQFAPVDQGARGGLARVVTLKKAIEKAISEHAFPARRATRFRLQSSR